jgi:hypothetical protein
VPLVHLYDGASGRRRSDTCVDDAGGSRDGRRCRGTIAAAGRVVVGRMDDTEQQTLSTCRLVDREGQVVGVRAFPTDGAALSWAEDVRYHEQPRVWIRRLERKGGDDWVFVSPAGE